MIISKTNIALDATVNVNPNTSVYDIEVVSDGDFSTKYIDALSTTVISFTLPTSVNLEYVAIGASNISTKSSVSIDTPEGGLFSYDGDLSRDESDTLFYTAQAGDHSSVSEILITIVGTGQLEVSEIAFGEVFEVPRGEQAGFSRPWSVPNIQSRSASDLTSAPVSFSYEARDLSLTLSVSKYIMENYSDGWYEMLKFATKNVFYIREDDDPTHSYACYNAKPAMVTADSQTRSLGGASMTFNAYSKGIL